MAEKLQETRKFDFRDFTLCTSMGALCYLIAITLGSGLIEFHSQNITVAARATAERKTFGHLS